MIPCEINGVTVKHIGEVAFANNRLTSVVIPDSVLSIGGMAFPTNKITSLAVGNGVTTI